MTDIAVSIRTAARMVELGEDTLRHAINVGELPAKRVGRIIRIETDDLREWFRGLDDART